MFKHFQGIFMQNFVKLQARIAFRKPKDNWIHPKLFLQSEPLWILSVADAPSRMPV